MSTLPLKEVTLYNNGYAVFVRKGEVKGSGSIDLYFPREDMPRVLKSLCLNDENRVIGNVSYTSSQPITEIRIDKSQPITALFSNLQGTSVKIVLSDAQEYQGRVLGIETSSDGAKDVRVLSLLLENDAIRAFNLDEVKETYVLDPDVVSDVHHSIDNEKNAKKSNMQKITVFYRGAQEEDPRQLTVKYGVQCKEWRSSYRIVLQDKEPTRLQLDGFAIVENTLNEDWDAIDLTLVAGAPMIRSPEGAKSGSSSTSPLELNIKQTDRNETFTIRAHPRDTIEDVKKSISSAKGYSVKRISLVFAGKGLDDGRHLCDYNILHGSTIHFKMLAGVDGDDDVVSKKKEFIMAAQDNLSYFKITGPVSAQRKQSAIVPLLHELLTGQQVVLYDESIIKGNPVCALVFLNSTSRTLEGGSLQVMSNDRVLGEGELNTMHPGDESVPIPYALELGCEVTVKYDSSKLPITHVSIKNGELTLVRSKQQGAHYSIVNRTDKVLDFMLNHPYLDGWELQTKSLTEEEQPVDVTDRMYQFRFHVKARAVTNGIAKNETRDFKIVEVTPLVETFSLSSASDSEIAEWESKYFDKTVTQELKKIFALKPEITSLSKDIYEKEAHVREIQSTQDRLRKNITTLDKHASGAEKYVTALALEEDKLTGVYSSIEVLKGKKRAIEAEFSRRIADVTFKRKIEA